MTINRNMTTAASLLALGFVGANSALAVTCDDIVFDDDARAKYEYVQEACLDVIERNGARFVKLHVRMVSPGRRIVTVQFQHRDGSWGPNTRLTTRSDVQVELEGRQVRMEEIPRHQTLNVYLEEGRWAAAITAPEVMEPPVEVIVVFVASEIVEPEPVAMAMLPATASPLPLFGLLGGIFALLGGLLTVLRHGLTRS